MKLGAAGVLEDASSSGGEEVVSKMTAKYPELGNPYTLWLAAYTQSYGDN